MPKRVILVSTVLGLVAGAALSLQVLPAAADQMTCREAAKIKYPDSLRDRLSFRMECRKAWKAAKAH